MGREFVEIFDQWVHTYDQSVEGKDKEYEDVFKHYDGILRATADLAISPVVEFGVGTGNLTQKMLERGMHVTGIEPNAAMREATSQKLPELVLHDGDFLDFPLTGEVRTFTSSYAFHHLTDAEKAQAFKLYAEKLPAGGKVVFADTVFESSEIKQQTIEFEEARAYANLVEDLQREYYTTLPVLRELIENAGFTVEFTQLNSYVWLIDATKKSEDGR
jgi:putative AdoMet-dependent methyltransferase